MNITIWDLDYYYADDKTNIKNSDIMRLSSYYKQQGDAVNFVLKEADIWRPADIIYIFKENSKTKNPPFEFYTNSKVKWGGKANKARINWKMSAAMLGCRPDYLLYPNLETNYERAEHIRLYTKYGEPLALTQEYKNSFKKKMCIVDDEAIWITSSKNIIWGLQILQTVKNLSFFEPIRVDILMSDKEIKEQFFKLKLSRLSKINTAPLTLQTVEKGIDFVLEFQKHFPRTPIKLAVKIDWNAHKDSFLKAYRDYLELTRLIVLSRQKGVRLEVAPMERRLDTPYFHLFEEITNYAQKPHQSWYDYLYWRYPRCNINIPATWSEPYRDLVRQTYENHTFFLIKWKDKKTSETEIPWTLLEKEFKYGI